MNFRPCLVLATSLGLTLAAQTPPPAAPAAPAPAAAAPAPPAPGTVKWRGGFWASAAEANEQTADNSLFLRSMDSGNGQLAVDGLQIGADVTLTDGFSLKFTLLGGQDGKVLNLATTPAETGSIAWPEAQLIWTGAADTIKIGRMYTPMGMEVMDDTQDITATRGILFTYAIPLAQVGVDWHHAFTPSWSTDVWVYNGEDKLQDNNQGKTAGLGLTYNYAGAADKFVTLMVFSGPEQTSNGVTPAPANEGNKRNRVSLAGQWTWGNSTLQFEGETASETMPAGAPKAQWSGGGLIYKYQFNDYWACFVRAETLKDNTGVRLGQDTTVGALVMADAKLSVPVLSPDLTAVSGALGVERKWHATFSRLEVREDSLNTAVLDASGKTFKSAISATWSIGTSF